MESVKQLTGAMGIDRDGALHAELTRKVGKSYGAR
jgi:hypothetical protein